MGMMMGNLVHPYIQSTTVLCDNDMRTQHNIVESHTCSFAKYVIVLYYCHVRHDFGLLYIHMYISCTIGCAMGIHPCTYISVNNKYVQWVYDLGIYLLDWKMSDCCTVNIVGKSSELVGMSMPLFVPNIHMNMNSVSVGIHCMCAHECACVFMCVHMCACVLVYHSPCVHVCTMHTLYSTCVWVFVTIRFQQYPPAPASSEVHCLL